MRQIILQNGTVIEIDSKNGNGQFTGKTDKNGNQIFEGNTIKITIGLKITEKREVIWCNDTMTFQCFNKQFESANPFNYGASKWFKPYKTLEMVFIESSNIEIIN